MSDAPTLFPHLHPPPERAVSPRPDGPFAGVALEQGIDRVLDYAIPARLAGQLQVGQRVRVPLGRNNRPKFGFVVSISPTTEHPKVKNIQLIADERVLVPPILMELARWMSRYYATALGVVLETAVPSAVKQRIGLGYNNIVRLARDRAQIQEILEKTKAPKRRAVLARLLQIEGDQGIDLLRLAEESGVKSPTVRKLVPMGLISIRPEVDLPRLDADLPIGKGDEKQIELNADQQRAFAELKSRLLPEAGTEGRFSVNLLHGVTGSGKTEIYLQIIAEVLRRGKKALVLVPEIALTPQTVERFRARFPRVAILHSGLTATHRHKFWHQISQGRADVVVGRRSAVFAPIGDLGVIVVDEEHESSYKQDQAPRYHGRDVAIKRAQLEGIPIMLGSATPSLETYWRCKQNPGPRHHYLLLPSRVRGLAMPAIEVVDMRHEQKARPGIHLVSQRLEHLLRTTLGAGKQAIILLNRRGYSNFVYCSSCAEPVHCKYCDVTMTYHRSAGAHAAGGSTAAGLHTGQLHCHYCLAVNPLPAVCPVCGKKLSLFGLGTQRVEEELARKIPEMRAARVDSDSMRNSRDYEATLQRFASGEIQVMLGTQMIAKGLDYPNVTLVGVISGDTALSLPDFRASERTFQLITQVSGRAGRGDSAGRVVLQTFMPEDLTIRAAVKQDYTGFAATELAHRKEVDLPPFSRMVRIVTRHQDQETLLKISQQLAEKITGAIAKVSQPVILRGPIPCAINRIANYWRQQIQLTSARPEALQEVLALVRADGALEKAESVAVDVDPISLM